MVRQDVQQIRHRLAGYHPEKGACHGHRIPHLIVDRDLLDAEVRLTSQEVASLLHQRENAELGGDPTEFVELAWTPSRVRSVG